MRIDLRTCDDWVAVYKDGKKVHENHSCSLEQGLEALGIPFTRVDLDEVLNSDVMPDGSDPFPEELPREPCPGGHAPPVCCRRPHACNHLRLP